MNYALRAIPKYPHLERKLSDYTVANAIEVGGYRSRNFIQQQVAIEVGVWKRLCWRESFRGMQQQAAIEVGAYRSRCLEKAMLERELSGDTTARGYRSRMLWK